MSATAGLTRSDAAAEAQVRPQPPMWEGAFPVLLLGAALSAILVATVALLVLAGARALG